MSAEHEIGKTSFHSQETQVQRGEGTCHLVGDGGGNTAQVSNSGVSEVPVHTHTRTQAHALILAADAHATCQGLAHCRSPAIQEHAHISKLFCHC